MKLFTRLLLLLCILSASVDVKAQLLGYYTFSQSYGSYTPLVGETVLESGTSIDESTDMVTLPFSFMFNGTNYSQIYVSSNGFMSFGPTDPSMYTHDPISTYLSGFEVISGFGYDLMGLDGSSEVAVQTLGISPSRTFVIQWKNLTYATTSSGIVYNFQVRLSETSNNVNIVYGTMSTVINTTSGEIGLRGTSNTEYNNRSTATSWSGTSAGSSDAATVALSPTCMPTGGLTYTWIPPPPCTAPTTQPTALALSPHTYGVDVSFTASVPPADNYLVVRTDNVPLTSMPVNGVTYTPGSPLGGGIVESVSGTGYTSSSLALSTIYRYTVFGYKNVACSGIAYNTSSPLTGTVLSYGPRAYTWVPASGSADYTIATNWSPARIYTHPQDTLIFNNGGTITVANVPQETLGGISITGSTAVKMMSATDDSLMLQSFFNLLSGSLTLTGSNLLKIGFVNGASPTATIAGTLNLGGSCGYAADNSITTVTGTVNDSGASAQMTSYCNCPNYITFAAGSAYNHMRNGGAIPSANYNAASTVTVSGVTNTAPSFVTGIDVGNLTWNCAGQSATVTISNLVSVLGNFNITSTHGDTLTYGGGLGLNVAGNFTQISGIYRITNSANGKLKVNGNTSLTGGVLDLTSCNSASANSVNLSVAGNLTQAAAHSIVKSGAASSIVRFGGDVHQAISISGSISSGQISYILSNAAGATLTGNLPLNSQATNTLSFGSWDGSGRFVYNSVNDTLFYASPGAITASGVEWPSVTSPAAVVLNMTGASPANRIALPGARTLTNNLAIAKGILVLNNNNLAVTNVNASLSVPNDTTGMIAADSTGALMLAIKAFSTSSVVPTYVWPIGTTRRNTTYSPVSVSYASNTVLRNVAIRIGDRKHPSDASTTNYLAKYWHVTDDGGAAAYTFNNIGFTFDRSNIVGYPEFRLNSWNGASWTQLSSVASGTTLYSYLTTPLNNMDFTGRPTVSAVYSWTGATSNDYTVATNWTPNRTIPSLSDVLQFNDGSVDSVFNVTPSDAVSRLIFTNNTTAVWKAASSGSATVFYTLSNYLPGTPALEIDGGSAFIVKGSANKLMLQFGAGDTSYATIAGRLEFQNTAVASSISFNNCLATVTGSGVLAAGTSNSGLAISCTASNLTVNGTYEHKYTTVQGTVPTFTWGPAATFLIDGFTTILYMPICNFSVPNIVYNCPAQIQTTYWGTGSTPSVTNTFSMISSGTDELEINTGYAAYFNVNNFVQTGGTFALTGANMNLTGNLTQSGGTFHANHGTGLLNFTGTAAQNVSFLNSAPGGGVTYRFGNPAGVNLTGTGTLTATFTINSMGGIIVATPVAHPVTTPFRFDYSGTSLSYENPTTVPAAFIADTLFYPTLSGPGDLRVNIGSGSTLTLPFSRTITGTLNMQSGDILIGANNLTIGTSELNQGYLAWGGGYIVPTTGVLKRWYSSSGVSTTAGTTYGYYPLKYGGANRSVELYFSDYSALTAGGTIAVTATTVPGLTTGLSVADGATTLTNRTNSSWTFTVGSGLTMTGLINAMLTAGSTYTYIDPSKLHVMRLSSVVGTHVAGTGTAPDFTAQRTGLSLADLTSGAFYIGTPDTMFTATGAYISVANGNWSNPATWNLGAAPPATATVYIANGNTVTINNPSCVAASITINPRCTLTGTSAGALQVDTFITNNGTLNIAGETVTLGPVNGGKRPFNSSGTLNVTSGTLNINGSMTIPSSGTFNQSGGAIVIDGNAGGVISASTTSPLLWIDYATVNATAGSITFVDPSATGSGSLSITGSIVNNMVFSGTHTFVFGNGISTTSGSGFWMASVTPLNNIVVNGSPSGTGRTASVSFPGITVSGDVRLHNSNAELQTGPYFNFFGSMYADANTIVTSPGLIVFANPANPQSVNGPGIYRNSSTSPTANFTQLQMRNGSASGVILNMNNPSFTDFIDFALGKIRAASGAIINTTGSYILSGSSSTGWIAGKYKTHVFSGSPSMTFPVGDTAYYTPVTLSFAPGSVLHEGGLTAGTITPDHPAIGTSGILPSHSVNRYYTLDTSDGFRLASLSSTIELDWNIADQDPAFLWSSGRAASYRSGAWKTELVTLATPTSVLVDNVGNDLAASYQVGSEGATPFLTSQPVNEAVCIGSNTAFTTGSPGGVFQWQVNNGSGWLNVTGGSLYGGVTTPTLTVSAAPLTINGYQYRCKVYNTTDTVYTVAASILVGSLAGSITGSLAICPGTFTNLSCSGSGGVWSSSAPGVCAIGSSGVATGISAGTALISYTLSTGCSSTARVTVNPNPASIGGTLTVCQGATTTLSDVTPFGTWSSGTPVIATIGSASGIATGVSGGIFAITYTVAATGCQTSVSGLVNPLPAPVTGSLNVCLGTTVTLGSLSTGGTWASSGTSIARIGSSSGVVTGMSTGTSIISYTIAGCRTTATVTVNPLPAAITGPSSVCEGSTMILSSVTSGGLWSSSASATASIGGTSATVSGVAAGTATITYALTATACYTTRLVIVNITPDVITGDSALCAGSTTTLSDVTPGGSWSSGSTGIASVGSGTGAVTGISAGAANITYALPTGCRAVATVSVNPLPATITGTMAVCEGLATTLSCATSSGSWSSNDITIASVDTTGVVSGIASGTTTISYTLPTGCYNTLTFTVNPLPDVITGAGNVCVGSATALACVTPGGAWTSSATGISRIGSASGTVSGISAGTANISYTLGTGCYSTFIMTVNPLPAAITGPSGVCTGVTITLSDPSPDGTWSLTGTDIASISFTGDLNGLLAGRDTVEYTLATGCFTFYTVTVNPLPAAITGASAVCTGSTITWADASGGGTWSSSSPTVVSINPSSGVGTGGAYGTATLTYTLPTGCFSTAIVSTDTIPVITVASAAYICIGTPDTCISSITGGIWISGDTTLAVVSSSGVVSGVGAGIVSISYSFGNACGTAYGSTNVTVYTIAQCDSILADNNISASPFDVELLPNPNAGDFSIVIHTLVEKRFSLSIINQLGQKVWEGESTSNSAQHVTGNLTPGVYILIAQNGSENKTIRFVCSRD